MNSVFPLEEQVNRALYLLGPEDGGKHTYNIFANIKIIVLRIWNFLFIEHVWYNNLKARRIVKAHLNEQSSSIRILFDELGKRYRSIKKPTYQYGLSWPQACFPSPPILFEQAVESPLLPTFFPPPVVKSRRRPEPLHRRIDRLVYGASFQEPPSLYSQERRRFDGLALLARIDDRLYPALFHANALFLEIFRVEEIEVCPRYQLLLRAIERNDESVFTPLQECLKELEQPVSYEGSCFAMIMMLTYSIVRSKLLHKEKFLLALEKIVPSYVKELEI